LRYIQEQKLKKLKTTSSVNVLIQKNNTETDKVADKTFSDEETEFLLEEYDNELSIEDDFNETSDETVHYEGVKVRYFVIRISTNLKHYLRLDRNNYV